MKRAEFEGREYCVGDIVKLEPICLIDYFLTRNIFKIVSIKPYHNSAGFVVFLDGDASGGWHPAHIGSKLSLEESKTYEVLYSEVSND